MANRRSRDRSGTRRDTQGIERRQFLKGLAAGLGGLTVGAPGVGGFLWQEYNALIYEHIILCILTIGLVGFALDRVMALVEKRFRTA